MIQNSPSLEHQRITVINDSPLILRRSISDSRSCAEVRS